MRISGRDRVTVVIVALTDNKKPIVYYHFLVTSSSLFPAFIIIYLFEMIRISERCRVTSSTKDVNLCIGTMGTPSMNSTFMEYNVNIIGIA